MQSKTMAPGNGGGIGHIPSLDGIRAVSFLLVFFAHCGWENVIPGGLGVTTFFFLSGYLITTLMRTEYERNGHLNLGHFWLRRTLRILPPFYIVLLVAYGTALFTGATNASTLRAFWAQALHFTNYYVIGNGYSGFPEFSGTGVYWSLAVEEHFYLLFPFLFIGMRRIGLDARRQTLLLIALCTLALAWRLLLVLKLGAGNQTDRTYMASDTRLDSILFGCLMAIGFNPMLDPAKGKEMIWKYAALPLALAALAASLVIRDPVFRETLRYTLQGAAFVVIFHAAVRFPNWLCFRWLNTRLMVFLGTLSYSLYLVHLGVIYILRDAIHIQSIPLRASIALPVSLILAYLMYRLVEKPCARLRRQLID